MSSGLSERRRAVAPPWTPAGPRLVGGVLLIVTVAAMGAYASASPRDDGAAQGAAHVSAATSRRPAAGEIPVDRLCAAAVEAALANPERARSLVVRARLAGWLPEMGFRVYRRWARTEGVTLEDPVTGAPIPVDIKSIDDVRYEWRATWDLSRIVFNPDEIPAHLEALRMADVRRDLQLMVIRLYFERKRLMSEQTTSDDSSQGSSDRASDGALRGASADASDSPADRAPPAPATAREKGRLRVLEIEAELDALSGGAFTEPSARGLAGPSRPAFAPDVPAPPR